MGYTNYWSHKTGIKQFPEQMLDDLRRIIAARPDIKIDNEDGGAPIITPTKIRFNGTDGNDYETFLFCPNGWSGVLKSLHCFCKTAYKNYDVFVKACLILGLKYGVLDEWSFDGNKKDDELYQETVKIFRKLKITLRKPRD